MRLIEVENKADNSSDVEIASDSSIVTQKSYHELSDRPVVDSNIIEQLHTNMELLADLQGRFSFLMKEIRYVLKA